MEDAASVCLDLTSEENSSFSDENVLFGVAQREKKDLATETSTCSGDTISKN